ncbi:MAG: PEP-CTERM sorting domain-containing protein [Tepidisphaeraceae bacterium]
MERVKNLRVTFSSFFLVAVAIAVSLVFVGEVPAGPNVPYIDANPPPDYPPPDPSINPYPDNTSSGVWPGEKDIDDLEVPNWSQMTLPQNVTIFPGSSVYLGLSNRYNDAMEKTVTLNFTLTNNSMSPFSPWNQSTFLAGTRAGYPGTLGGPSVDTLWDAISAIGNANNYTVTGTIWPQPSWEWIKLSNPAISPNNITMTITAFTSTCTPLVPLLSMTNSEIPTPTVYGNQLANATLPTSADQGVITGPEAASNILNVGGGGSGYALAQATDINNGLGDDTNWAEADGFTPGVEEVAAFQVDVNGVLATQAQVDYLISEANAIGGLSADMSLLDTAPQPDLFSSIYNLFLDDTNSTADEFIGWDLSNSNDSNLNGYTITAVAVAVVPEPMSLGLLSLGGVVGLMSRRHRRV